MAGASLVPPIVELKSRLNVHGAPRPYAIPEYIGVHQLGPHPVHRPRGVGVRQSDAEYWLGIVAPLAYAASYQYDDAEDRKTLTYACGLLGLPWLHVMKSISDSRVYGHRDAAAVWYAHMNPPREKWIGFVYTARKIADPETIKIGFSRTPQKRMRALSRAHGTDIILHSSQPATILHEWALHQLMWNSRVATEWYPRSAVPEWLLAPEPSA